MKARTLKELIGWSVARAKGGRLRRPYYEAHVQCSRADNDLAYMRVSFTLAAAAGSEDRLRRWQRYADTTDDSVVSLCGSDWQRLAVWRELMEAEGFIERRHRLPEVEQYEWTEITTKIKTRTLRIRERVAGSPRHSPPQALETSSPWSFGGSTPGQTRKSARLLPTP